MLRSPHKLLAGVAIALVVMLFVMTARHKSAPKTVGTPTSIAASPTDTASVDNDSETIRHFMATMKVSNKNIEAVKQQNEAIKKENDALRALVTQKVESGQLAITSPNMKTDEVKVTANLQAQVAELKNQIQQLGSSHPATQSNTPSAYPVGESRSLSGLSSEQGMNTIVLDEDAPSTANGQGIGYASAVQNNGQRGSAQAGLPTLNAPHLNPTPPKQITKIPFYTIPALSNLANTVLMNSLIGEVPQGNTFEQPPFPFQALVGRHDLLAANGIHLPPNISGMKLSGYSVGVGSFVQGLSCSRSYITKVLFVFADGHFVVYGKDPSGSNVDPNDTLGYLSDVHGNPCIQGTYVSNAARVLTMLTGMSMVQGAGEGLQQAQTNTLTGFDGTTTVFNGSVGKYAVGNGLSTSMDKASTYMLDRLKGTFDIVYTPASSNGRPTAVVANFTKTIPIDYNLNGRQIRYEQYGQLYAKNNRNTSLD